MTRVTWTPTARRDRESQIAYIAADSQRAAISVGDRIDTAVLMLGGFPEIGRRGRVSGTRELAIAGTPYIVIYRINDSGVQIVRLLHGAQQWPPRD